MTIFKKILLIAVPALLATSCSKGLKGTDDLKNANAADSMMYYFGQMQAAAYWQDAQNDTSLATKKAREEFIEGFRASMKMDKESTAYNKGLQLGLRLSIRLREFDSRYGIEFSEKMLADAMEAYLETDNRESLGEAQQGFYAIKDRLELEAADRELGLASQKLASEASKRGFILVSDTLYAKDITPAGRGPKFKDGDKVAVEVTASTLDGNEIVTRQFPDSIVIGAGRVPRIVCLGIHTMTNGQTRTFMTTPRTLFGKRYATYHLPYDEPVVFTVKAIQN